MTPAALILLALKASICLIVFSFGLRATLADVVSLARRPRELLRSLLAMYGVMPLIAVGIAKSFDIPPAVEIALLALSVSPVPPILPRRQLQAGGEHAYVLGLLATAALLAIVLIPVAVSGISAAFAAPASMPPLAVAALVLGTVLVPLAAGVLIRRLAPEAAARLALAAALLAFVVLALGGTAILVHTWDAIRSLVGSGTLLVFAAFVGVGLVAGHLLGSGSSSSGNRAVLALATACRHPGVALAIAHANYPNQKLVPAAILLYLLTSVVLSTLYLAWHRRRMAPPAAPEASPTSPGRGRPPEGETGT